MYGPTRGARRPHAAGPLWLDRLVEHGPLALAVPKSPPDLRGYLELALDSGFPEPVLGAMSATARTRWLESYLGQLLTRDVAQLDGGRDPERLHRYFEALAGHSASTVSDSTLAEAVGLTRKTAAAYDQLLDNLLVSERLHAWTSNRLKRLTRAPKRYLVDPALAATALHVDVAGVLRDGTLLGGVLDTFVAAQLRAELPLTTTRARMFHLRQEQGRHEVDILLEFSNGRVIAIEVKADGAPTADAAKHLRWLRDELGAKFEAGVVLHTGPRSFALDDRIAAVPICSLWG
jgi:predicted AAA+ superfamily ATPase